MGTLLLRLQEHQILARKERQRIRAGILTYALGELGRKKVKDTSDASVLTTLKKIRKNLRESLRISYVEAVHTEVCILSEFIPEELDKETLRGVIERVITDNACDNMGQTMKALKEDSINNSYDYDGREAAAQIKEIYA